jgi:hypothetical protein
MSSGPAIHQSIRDYGSESYREKKVIGLHYDRSVIVHLCPKLSFAIAV